VKGGTLVGIVWELWLLVGLLAVVAAVAAWVEG
jgi:hypothetical protein